MKKLCRPGRKADLLLRFESIEAIKKATKEELEEVVPSNIADEIIQFFHK